MLRIEIGEWKVVKSRELKFENRELEKNRELKMEFCNSKME